MPARNALAAALAVLTAPFAPGGAAAAAWAQHEQPLGARARAAIRRHQNDFGTRVNGFLNEALLACLRLQTGGVALTAAR